MARAPGRPLLPPRGAAYLTHLGVRYTVKRVVIEEPEGILFTEVTEPPEPVGAERWAPSRPRASWQPATGLPHVSASGLHTPYIGFGLLVICAGAALHRRPGHLAVLGRRSWPVP